MKRIRKSICRLLVICMLVTMLPMSVFAESSEIARGTCGDNLTWVLRQDGVLTISGEGTMKNYSSGGAPWYVYRNDILQVVIEDGVTSIGKNAFYSDIYTYNSSYNSLTSVEIPDSVTSIGTYAFGHCTELCSVNIGNGVISINSHAFYDCDSLISITIPEGVTSIGDYAFTDCDSLSTVVIPSSVTRMGSFPFDMCGNLLGIWVDEANTQFSSDSNGVLFNKDKTVLIGAPGGLDGDYTIPEGVTKVNSYAFDYCYNLINVIIPESVTNLGNYAFLECTSLKGIWIDAGNEFYSSDSDGVLFSKDKTKLIHAPAELHDMYTIPDSVTSISSSAFSDSKYKSLKSIIFAGNAPTIGSSAFYLLTITAYYPVDNDTWTEDVMQNYGGNITWIAYEESQCAHTWDSGTETKEQTCTEGGEITFTCTLCGENKVENSLPLGHDYVERICNRCGKRDFILEYDVWSFDNSEDSFGAASEGYYISSRDYQRLIGNLTETERYALLIRETEKEIGDKGTISTIKQRLSKYNVDNDFSDDQCVDWGGSCYGMSTWVCLNSYGIRKASDIDGFTSTLNLYNSRSEVESAINFYHNQKYLPNYYHAVEDCMTKTQTKQLELLETYGKNANNTGDAFLIAFNWYSQFNDDGTCDESQSAGHAVVGYGWEKITPRVFTEEDIVNVSGMSFNYRILIYDCSNPTLQDDVALYYNDDGVWYIPQYHIVSTASDTADGRSNNGRLVSITKDISVLNCIDYITGECTPLVGIATLETAADLPYAIECNGYVTNITGFTATSETEDCGIIVSIDSNITSDGELTSATSTAILPDADSYTVVSENDGISFSFRNENYLTSCSVGSSGSMIFLQNGTVSVSADESAMYYLNLVANDGCNNLPWYQVEIAGTDASEISVKKANEGLIVHCDNLDTIIIAVTDEEGTTEVSGSTNGKSVLITERNGDPTLYEDTDGDGIYETDITACVTDAHRYSTPVFSWTEDNGCQATFTCIQGDDTQIIDCTVTSETTPATETEAGKTVYTATIVFDGQTYTDTKTVVTPATGHVNHITTLVSAVDATCEHTGNTAYYTCLGCEDWFLDASGAVVIADKTFVVTVMLGHSFTNYVSNSDASCTVDGIKTAKCDRCDATDTVIDVGSSKGHEYETTWSKDEDGHWHNCSCGDKTEDAPHTYSEWVTTKKADVGVEGSKERTCSVCGYKQTEKLPATTTPATGDNTQIGLLFAMMLISACGIITLLFISLKKKGKCQRYNC